MTSTLPAADAVGFRLSPQQRRQWQSVQDTGPEAIGVIRCRVRITGDVSRSALEEAISLVVGSHEILCTAYHRPEGISVPLQVIADPYQVELSYQDLAALDPAQQDRQLAVAARRIECEVAGLNTGRALAAHLCTTAPGRHELLLAAPSLCLDAGAVPRLVTDIAAAYSQPRQDLADHAQYADVAEWLWDLLEDTDADAERDRWAGLVRQVDEAASLPFLTFPSREEAAGENSRNRSTLRLPAGSAQRLDGLAAELGVPVRDLLLAAWLMLQSRYTGSAVSTCWSMVPGRDRPELDAVLGPLERPVPVVTLVPDDGTARTVAADIDRQMSDAVSAHYYCDPASARPAPVPAPVFRFLDLSGEYPAGDLRLSVTGLSDSSPSGGLGISVICRDGIDIVIDAPRTISHEADLRPVLATFAALVESVLDEPDTPARLLDLSRGCPAPPGRDLTASPVPRPVYEVIDDRAVIAPHSAALVQGAAVLSYGELASQSAEVAAALRCRGIKPGDRVAVLMDRTVTAVVSMIGVMKARAAYVVIDPESPAERINGILAEADARAVICDQRVPAGVTDGAVLVGDLLGSQGHPPAGEAHPREAVYVSYTSGSTGRPKGVVLEHEQLWRYAQAVLDELRISSDTRFAVVSTLTADLGYTGLYPTLMCGGSVHVLDRDSATDPEAFSEFMREQRISCLKIVPSHLAELLNAAADPRLVLPSDVLVLGGEATTAQLVERVAALAPGCRVLNHYGPTETTVGVSLLDLEDHAPGVAVPLGPPLGAARLHVLDDRLRELPPWVRGELYVGGPTVARGYLGRPGETAQRFLASPFPGGAGARMYRTGDLVMRLPGGRMQFLGRSDDQVKINGYRIEPAEISATILQIPGVLECVVQPVQVAGHAPSRLVAYVVAPGGPSADEIEGRARALLPRYMVPGSIVLLDAMPRTQNGKIDKKALPAPSYKTDSVAQPPRDALELSLLRVWESVLDVQPLGVNDDFFHAGGSSLQAVRLIAEIRRVLGTRVSASALFAAPTVATMAEYLQEKGSSRPSVIPIQRREMKPALFLVHAGGGNVLGYLDFARGLPKDQAVYGLEAPGLDGRTEPVASLRELAAIHAEAIRSVQDTGPYVIAGWCLGGIIAHEIADQLTAAGEQVAQLFLIDSAAPRFGGEPGEAVTGPLSRQDLLKRFAYHYQLAVEWPRGAVLPDEDLAEAVLAAIRRQHILPADSGKEELRRLLRVYESNIRSVEEYERGYVPVADVEYPMHLIRAADEIREQEPDLALGWGDAVIKIIPGDHYSMLKGHAADELSGYVTSVLNPQAMSHRNAGGN